MQFASSLGQDTLIIDTLDGVEGLSRLFDFQAELFADVATEIDPTSLVGTKVTIAIALLDVQGTRYINGLVAAFEQTSGEDELSAYRAHIVPSLWVLTLSTNCRVFQDMNVMAIIKAVITPYGLSVKDTTKAAYKSLDYCTQYNETDFNFISRLAEQFGIFYWFEHKNGDNTVAFGDDRSVYVPCPSVSKVQYSPQGSGKEDMYHSVVSDIRATASMVTGQHMTRDADYMQFTKVDNTDGTSSHAMGSNAHERYSFPSGEASYVKVPDKEVTTPAHGEIMLTAQRDASDVSANLFHGVSTARTFIPGFTFDLSAHPRGMWNQTYLLTEVVHHIEQSPPYRSDAPEPAAAYTNRFVSIESTRQFRPVARTPKPRIPGPQTAIVVAQSGDEIYLDKKGRVCVQFFWDRKRQMTPDNTWVRVAQPWAGNGWGTFFWPRLNDEVVVHFLDGDPDAPLVVGSVYNGVNMPKYELPEMGTRSGIVTRSSKGGSASNANELRFEDLKGSEQIFLNAEMDMDHRTENDNRRFVGGKDSLKVVGAQYEEIGGDHHLNAKANKVEKVGQQSDLDIGTNWNAKVGENLSLNVGQNLGEKVGMNYAMDAGMAVYIKAGMTLVIESGLELCLKGAGGFITIGPAGIAISGTMVMINSGGAPVSGSPAQLQSPGAPTAPDVADDGTKGGKLS